MNSVLAYFVMLSSIGCVVLPGLPQIHDLEIPDFFQTISRQETIFLRPPMTGILPEIIKKIRTNCRTCSKKRGGHANKPS